jgi:hypothetical protein
MVGGENKPNNILRPPRRLGIRIPRHIPTSSASCCIHLSLQGRCLERDGVEVRGGGADVSCAAAAVGGGAWA